MSVFERYLTVWVLLCIVVGIGLGQAFPGAARTIGSWEVARVNLPVGLLIWVMIIPMLLKVDFSALGEVRHHVRGIGVTLFVNWLVKPFSMAFLGWLFIRQWFAPYLPADQLDSYIAGLILLAAAPCTAMVFVWSRLTGGDPLFTLSQVALNDSIMIVAFAPLVAFLLGLSAITVPWDTLLTSVVLYIVIPVVLAQWWRRALLARGQAAFDAALQRIGPWSIAALLLTLVLLFAFQGEAILRQPLVIALLAVPILIQVFFNSALAYWLNRAAGEKHAVACPSALIGASNFFELAVATAISLSDNITTLVTSSVSLVRAIVTCIASLGTTCAEVPIKTSAVVTAVVGLGTKGVTLAAKAASLPLVSAALAATIKARDLARKSAIPPVSNPEEARRQLECTLWARNCGDDEGVVKTELNPDWREGDDPKDKYRIVYRRDANGNPIPRLDADGKPMYDSSGNPLYEPEYEAGAPRKGLEQETEEARKSWQTLQVQVDALETWRLAPWGVAVAGNGDLSENGRIVERIDVEATRQRICDGNWKDCRYGKAQVRVECRYVGANAGQYVLNGDTCTHVGTETITEPDPNDATQTITITRPKGDRDRVEITDYVYNQDQAVTDAIALRTLAQDWSSLRMRKEELDREIKLREDNFNSWFSGGDSILSKMKAQRDDSQHCGASPQTAMTRQKCDNANLTVLYIETCQKPEPVRECKAVSPGTGRYRDAACTDRNGSDAEKNYGWVETLSPPPYPRDPTPDAVCKPNMQDRLNELRAEQAGLQQGMDNARNAYNGRINRKEAPWLTYPTGAGYDWFQWAIEITRDKDDNPVSYAWKQSPIVETYTYSCKKSENQPIWVPGDPNATPPTAGYWKDNWVEVDSTCTANRRLPFYAPEPYGGGRPPLLITSPVNTPLFGTLQLYELLPENACAYFNSRQWNGSQWWWPGSITWGDTYKVGLYCQRYPYSRAFEDWKRAKLGASNAKKHYEDLYAQYEKLKQEYEDMRSGSVSGGDEIPMAFGAEPALEWADSRGSAGPQPLVQP